MRRALLALVVATSLAAPAAAQDSDATEDAEEDASEDSSSDAEGSESADVEDPALEEARARFRQALALAGADNCEGAIAELEAVLEMLPPERHPVVHFNIGRCQERLARYDLAITAYRAFLEGAPADDPARAEVTRTVEQLGRLLGTIRVTSDVEAEVWLGDRVVGTSPGDVLVPGGTHVIELRAPGRLPARREVRVSAGSEVTVDVSLERAQTVVRNETTTNVRVDAPPLPAALTVTMIAASALTIGVGVGFGIHALSLSEAERMRDARLPRDGSAIDEAALFADVFFIAGGVLAAATVAMAFLTDWGGDDDRATPRARLLVGPGAIGLRVEGVE